ncbi:MAG: phage tail tape measure protein, partial [archaeon]
MANPFSESVQVKIDGDSSGLQSAVGGAISSLDSLGGAVAGAGTAMAGLSGGAIKESIDAYASFDKAMTESQAIMGDLSGKEMSQMEKAAREVGRTTMHSADDAADSYFYLASAGMDAEQAIDAMLEVAKFAQAGNFDMAKATDIATDSLSALGMASEDPQKNLKNLRRVQDTMVKANQLANASVEQFGQSMMKAGPAVQSAGYDVEEAGAMLSVFADQGLKGRRAGTILKRTLNDLQKQAVQNADKFEELGIEVFDADGNMRPMNEIVKDMEGSLGDMSSEQRAAAMAQLGLTEQSRRGMEMLMGNSDALEDYENKLDDAGGATDEVAEKQMESFTAQLGLLKDNITDIGLSIGSVLVPALGALLEPLNSSVQAFAEWLDAGNEIYGVAVLVGGVIGGLAGAFVGLQMMGVAVTPIIIGIASAFGVMLAVAVPVIAAVAAIAYAWKNNLFSIRQRTRNVLNTVQSTWETVSSRIREIVTVFWDGVTGEFNNNAGTIRTIVQTALQTIRQIVMTVLQAVRQFWQTHGQQIRQIAQLTYQLLRQIIQSAMTVIRQTIQLALQAVQRLWNTHAQTIMTRVQSLTDAIMTFFTTLFNALLPLIQGALQRILAFWQRHGDKIEA